MSFEWYGPSHTAGADPVPLAIAEFMRVMQQPDRFWTEHSLAIAIGEFKGLLKRASRGRAVPVDHVKKIDDTDDEHLFELRWEFPTLRLDEQDDGKEPRRVAEKWHVRMYHFEPELYPTYFVGLHIHRKVIAETDAETRRLQDLEINEALDRHDEGAPGEWDLAFAQRDGSS